MSDAAADVWEPTDEAPKGAFGLWDAVSLVIGIVVGTAIFRSSPQVFQNTASLWQALGAWALGGVLSLFGALCYAELATTYPRDGGDYVYLTRAFGPWAGFLFGWSQLTVVFAGNLGIMAYAFGDYAVRLCGLDGSAVVWFAVASIVGMTALNAWAASTGIWTQNLLTAAKVAGLAAVVLSGAWIAFGGAHHERADAAQGPAVGKAIEQPADSPPASVSFGLAMVFVLYAYGGWNDAAFVAAEVRNRRRNVPRALVGGVAGVAAIYLAMNAAYLTLGFEAARHASTPAADVLQAATGAGGAKFVSALVMISALGAINGMILSRSRVFAVMGADHWVFSWLASWRGGDNESPRAALVAQAAVTLGMIVAVGTERGRGAIDAMLAAMGASPVPWQRFDSGFETLVVATAPVFWALFLATGVAMIVLRLKDQDVERPFRAPLFPLTPLVFCATCAFMLRSSVVYAGWLAAAGAAPAALGLLLYALTRKR